MNRKIKIFKTAAEFIPGEPCFLPDEIAYCRKLAGVRDPEEQREFWRVLLEKKEADPTYLVYQDFPLSITNDLQDPTDSSKTGSLYDHVGQIITDLKNKGVLR